MISLSVFFFNDTATTEIYTLSLHDALPISTRSEAAGRNHPPWGSARSSAGCRDRKSTRLNSSHTVISYAVFCLKKKNKIGALEAATVPCGPINDLAQVFDEPQVRHRPIATD